MKKKKEKKIRNIVPIVDLGKNKMNNIQEIYIPKSEYSLLTKILVVVAFFAIGILAGGF